MDSAIHYPTLSPYKVYVRVTADFLTDGSILPVQVTWEDGRRFEVDRLVDIRRAASPKAGGCGIRYTCMIRGRPHYLYYEDNNKWFVEAK